MESLIHELDILSKENKLLHQLIEIYRDHLNARMDTTVLQINRVQTELLDQIKALREQWTNYLMLQDKAVQAVSEDAQAAEQKLKEEEKAAAPAAQEAPAAPAAQEAPAAQAAQQEGDGLAQQLPPQQLAPQVTPNLNKKGCYCM
jgi:peptidoglycan hydrolase CwlO-like protein